MSSKVLIRDIPDQLVEWFHTGRPTGYTQQEFLLSLLVDAHQRRSSLDLFGANREPARVYSKLPFTFIDLFAGIGGFRCGMTAAGGTCVFSSEWDKHAVRTYSDWYGDDEVYDGDIRELDLGDVPDHDVLCAGFPCQPFSLAGVSKKKSLGRKHGFEDEKQGNLFFSIMDIVDAKRPPVLFLENVKNLKSHDKKRTWGVIRQNIEDREYLIRERVVDAQGWVPQHRERAFIVCFDSHVFGRDDHLSFEFPRGSGGHTLSCILHDDPPDTKYQLSDKLWKYLQDYAAKHKAKGNGFGYGLVGGEDVARTLSARYHKDGSEVLIKQDGWKNPRRLTPSEAASLMGFTSEYAELFGHEDGFPQVVSDTQAYRQFGNAVVPKVVEAVAHKIVDVLGSHIVKVGNGCLIKGRGYERNADGRS